MMISALGLVTRDTNMLLGIAEMLVFMMSGANFPVERLPVIFRWVSLILPLSHSVKSIRYTLSGFYAKA
ncbi:MULTISPECIES: ABC transporter permease [unclassified Thermotoga]|uniref:ABC transporter permease n=2 Tax=Thermotoga TaxID=2335 RepID=UPI000AE72A72